jgi:hypothetical protein
MFDKITTQAQLDEYYEEICVVPNVNWKSVRLEAKSLVINKLFPMTCFSAYGKTSLSVRGHYPEIGCYDESHIEAEIDCVIYAKDSSFVVCYGCSVRAFDFSSVVAYGASKVFIFNKVNVTAGTLHGDSVVIFKKFDHTGNILAKNNTKIVPATI